MNGNKKQRTDEERRKRIAKWYSGRGHQENGVNITPWDVAVRAKKM